MNHGNRGKRGRPATASREDVLRLARDQFLAGRRVDLTTLARELGVGRATIYRWFGSREGLLSEVVADEFEQLIDRERAQVQEHGARGLLEVFDRVNRRLTESMALRCFLEQERAAALRLLTASDGGVQQRSVACIAKLIAAEVAAGRYDPPADAQTLAYAVVRLAEAFLYNDAAFGLRSDHARLRDVEAALLGVPRPGGRCADTGAPRSVVPVGSG